MYHLSTNMLLLHPTFMLSVVNIMPKGEVGDRALNGHGNYIVDYGKLWKNHGIVFLNFCGNPEYFMNIKLLTKHHSEFLSLKGGCTGSSESIHVKMPHCWKPHVVAQIMWACGEKDILSDLKAIYLLKCGIFHLEHLIIGTFDY